MDHWLRGKCCNTGTAWDSQNENITCITLNSSSEKEKKTKQSIETKREPMAGRQLRPEESMSKVWANEVGGWPIF